MSDRDEQIEFWVKVIRHDLECRKRGETTCFGGPLPTHQDQRDSYATTPDSGEAPEEAP